MQNLLNWTFAFGIKETGKQKYNIKTLFRLSIKVTQILKIVHIVQEIGTKPSFTSSKDKSFNTPLQTSPNTNPKGISYITD